MNARAPGGAPLSDAELVAALEAALGRGEGEARCVTHLTRRRSPYSSSAPIDDLDVRLPGEERTDAAPRGRLVVDDHRADHVAPVLPAMAPVSYSR